MEAGKNLSDYATMQRHVIALTNQSSEGGMLDGMLGGGGGAPSGGGGGMPMGGGGGGPRG